MLSLSPNQEQFTLFLNRKLVVFNAKTHKIINRTPLILPEHYFEGGISYSPCGKYIYVSAHLHAEENNEHSILVKVELEKLNVVWQQEIPRVDATEILFDSKGLHIVIANLTYSESAQKYIQKLFLIDTAMGKIINQASIFTIDGPCISPLLLVDARNNAIFIIEHKPSPTIHEYDLKSFQPVRTIAIPIEKKGCLDDWYSGCTTAWVENKVVCSVWQTGYNTPEMFYRNNEVISTLNSGVKKVSKCKQFVLYSSWHRYTEQFLIKRLSDGAITHQFNYRSKRDQNSMDMLITADSLIVQYSHTDGCELVIFDLHATETTYQKIIKLEDLDLIGDAMPIHCEQASDDCATRPIGMF